MRLRQIGNNLLINFEGKNETIVFPKGYNFDKIFSLAFKFVQDGNETALKLLNRELDKYRNKEKTKKTPEERLIKNVIKKVQKKGFDGLGLVNIPEEFKDKVNKPHIKNFIAWLALNDNSLTRNTFIKYLNSKNPYITKNGFIVSVREVWKTKGVDELYSFVQSSCVKIKKWKKSRKNYKVVKKDNKYELRSVSDDCLDSEYIGNLDDLFYYPKTETVTYYSDYNKKNLEKRENWKIGDIVNIAEKGTHSSICGINQLHIRSNPLDLICSQGYGDTCIIVLVNPKDVINVAHDWKYTTARMYIAAEIERSEIREFFNTEWDRFDHDYLEKDLRHLKNISQSDFSKQIDNNDVVILGNKISHIPKEIYLDILQSRIKLLD